MSKTYLGIDPGKFGAWALVDEEGKALHVERLPYIGGRLDVVSWWTDVTANPKACGLVGAAIEEPFTKYGEANQTSLVSGINFGRLTAATALAGLPTELPKPAEWKKRVGLNSDKDYSRETAGRAWPHFLKEFRFKNSDGKAEALWIAEWLRRKTQRIKIVEMA